MDYKIIADVFMPDRQNGQVPLELTWERGEPYMDIFISWSGEEKRRYCANSKRLAQEGYSGNQTVGFIIRPSERRPMACRISHDPAALQDGYRLLGTWQH